MVGEAFKNEFSAGMNQDLAMAKIPPNIYYDCTNMRPSTDKGLSDTSLENIKGLLDLINIPDTPAVSKLTLDLTVLGATTITITNNGVPIASAGTFNVTATSTPEDFYNFLITDAAFNALNLPNNLFFNNLFLLFNPLSTLITTIASSTGGVLITTFIPAQSDLEIIGSTYINNDIYLLTTNNTSKTPGGCGEPPSAGQIWLLDINNVNNTAAPLTLIYNNFLNFSTYNAIAPSAILGRYENQAIQRIYWTDFYNKVRTINVKDPQAFILDISVLDITPSVDFDIPILQSLQSSSGNNMAVGVYQTAYRLKNVGGAITNYSELSNLVTVVGANEATFNGGGTNWANYVGSDKGSMVSKAITWKIDNLDRDFTFIEIIVLFRDTIDGIPVITTIYDLPVNDDSITFIYDGTQDTLPVSLSEFLLLTGVFTHAKTLTTKDNRLIVGNVNSGGTECSPGGSEIDFDARAFRATTSGGDDINLTNNGIDETVTLAVAILSDETDDSINKYTDPLRAGFYKPGTAILGGAGVNVSYEFYTVAIQADLSGVDIPASFGISGLHGDAIYRRTNSKAANPIDLGVKSVSNDNLTVSQLYPTTSPTIIINDGFKTPQINGLLRGYHRDEIYRFGIQFFDKSKNPLFVKWIGDIKMPDHDDSNVNSFYEDGDATGITDFRLSFTATHDGGLHCYVQSLGIKFTIDNLDTIKDQIDGYSIVRIKREESDKSIISQGYITRVDVDTSTYYQSGATQPANADLNFGFGVESINRAFFVTPDILDGGLTIPAIGMTLKSKCLLGSVGTRSILPENYDFIKYYDHIDFVQNSYILDNVLFLGFNGTNSDLGTPVANRTRSGSNYSLGNAAYFFRTTLPIPDDLFGVRRLYNVERVTNLDSLYKGNTYPARANNEYISTSHYRPIRTTSTITSDTFQVFGGDTFVNLYDSMRLAKNWNGGGATPDGKRANIFFLAIESSVNTDLRHGLYTNKDLRDDGITWDGMETYNYNNVYSAENSIKQFFPKPDPFILNNEFINRFYISEVKINGELSDSWSVFKTLNYWDVEGSYGAINGVSILQNEVYFIQDKAFGRLLINPRTAVTSTTGSVIQLGRGNVIDSHDYISVETGSIHQFSFLKSGYSLYFIDARHNKMFQFQQNKALTPESDIKGMHSWLIKNLISDLEVTDRPVYEDPLIGINGIHGVYDYVNDELIYTFFRNSVIPATSSIVTNAYTLVFSEKLNVYTGFYTHFPKNYVTNNRVIVSADPTELQELYLHNFGDYGQFYGVYQDSNITFTSNPKPEFTKTFNNLVIQTDVQNGTTLVDTDSGLSPIHESFNKIEVSNNHQQSGSIVLTAMTNLVRFFRSWRTEVPRHNQPAAFVSAGLFSRMTDKYLKVKLSFTNNGNKRFILHNVISFFKSHFPK